MIMTKGNKVMKRIIGVIAIVLLPVFAYAQNLAPLTPTATVETAFGSVASSYAEKLSAGTYILVDVVNDTDCDVQVRFDDVTGTPDSVIPAGTSETIDFAANGGYVNTSVSLQYMSGETCSSGSVYMKGVKR